MKSGLVSITFRKLSPGDIIELVSRAGLHGIEWGGDVHVPHGDLSRARQVAEQTRDAGLEVLCYGSYFRLADETGKSPAAGVVLDSAEALGAPLIRVWAGTRGSAEADDAYTARVADEAVAFAEHASSRNIGVAFEYHGGTLTDSVAGTAKLLERARHPALSTLWQPPTGGSEADCRASLEAVRDRLSNLHVFTWEKAADGKLHRQALAAGETRWRGYLEIAHSIPGERAALIEFVRDDAGEQFLQDAATLCRWLEDR